MTVSELEEKSKSRLNDADLLFKNRHWEGAIYLCGYSWEFKLKARICRSLKWNDYKDDFDSFKTHSLTQLLTLSGYEEQIKNTAHFKYWSKVIFWNPELRYNTKPETFTEIRAQNMIENTKKLLPVL